MTKQHGGAIVDLGNVIVAHWLSNISPENFLTYDYNSIPEAPGVCEILKRLNDRLGGNVTVVYNSTGIADEKIRAWLEAHKFVERTGIPLERIRRTINKSRDKTPFMNQTSETHYGTTVVIDDRLEVMSHFVGKVPHLLLFRFQLLEIADLWKDKKLDAVLSTGVTEHVRQVKTWSEIEHILST